MCYNDGEIGPRGDQIKRMEDFYMPYVITDECLSCGTCAANCPVEAIDMGDLHYEIDPEKCVECGTCAANCPAEAIISE